MNSSGPRPREGEEGWKQGKAEAAEEVWERVGVGVGAGVWGEGTQFPRAGLVKLKRWLPRIPFPIGVWGRVAQKRNFREIWKRRQAAWWLSEGCLHRCLHCERQRQGCPPASQLSQLVLALVCPRPARGPCWAAAPGRLPFGPPDLRSASHFSLQAQACHPRQGFL